MTIHIAYHSFTENQTPKHIEDQEWPSNTVFQIGRS